MENLRPETDATTRFTTVDFPVPEGAEITIMLPTLGQVPGCIARLLKVSFNVLRLLAQLLDFYLHLDRLASDLRADLGNIAGFGEYSVRFAIHLL